MRTRVFIFIAILSVLSGNVSSQNPTRRVLYTMNQGEWIVCYEHFVGFYADGYKFALVVTDEPTQRNTLIFNGERVPYGRIARTAPEKKYVPSQSIAEDTYDDYLCYLDVNEPDGYILKCVVKCENSGEKDRYEYWVNRGGTMEGPYEYVWCDEEVDDEAPKSKAYHYVLADRVYDNVDGKVSRSKGIFKMPYYYSAYARNEKYDQRNTYISVDGVIKRFDGDCELYVNGDNYIVCNHEQGNLYFNGEQKVGGKRIIDGEVCLNGKGDYAYISQDYDDKYHIVKNGVRLNNKGYSSVGSMALKKALYLTENGDLAYAYQEESGIWRIHLPGVDKDAEYRQIANFIYLDNGRYAFMYSDEDRSANNSWYVKTDKSEFGPYNLYILFSGILYDGGEHFAFTYCDGKGGNYVKTDKTQYGPYNNNYPLLEKITDSDCYYSVGIGEFCNGTMLKPDTNEDTTTSERGLDIGSHSFYFNYGYDYVVIDGRRFGKAVPFEYRYDKDKNAFVWYCIEGSELVVYEYALD